MPQIKSAFADDASIVTRLLAADPEFDEIVYRSLTPLSICLAAIFAVFVLLGFVDGSAGEARLPIVATDILAVLIFLAIFLALRAGIVPRRLTYALGIFIACIPLANTLLAFALTQNPFFLSYLPMVAIVCGAYILSLPWLAATLLLISAASFVVVVDVLPLVTMLRYVPALIGSYLVSLLVFFTRRWHIINTHRALLAQEAEAAERMRAESRLAHALRLESVGQLVSGIAHDFNNLLTIIVGYTDSLLETADEDSALHRDLQEIQGAGQRASALAQNLLAFSRQQLMQLRVVEIDDLIVSARSLISRSMPPDIRLRFELDASDANVAIDPLQMEQVLVNLALNARDAMADKPGELTIATRVIQSASDGAGEPQPDLVEIRVTDTGSGMTEDVRERVFEPFFTTKQRGSGTGLGLAMAHGIVTQCAGTIDVDSTHGHGTTFTIRLPQVDAPVQETRGAADAPARTESLAGVAVLVVDDEKSVCGVVARTLRQHGCSVEVADSAVEALELAARKSFDLLLTDVSMPGMSGIDLLDTLRQRNFSGPALLMSGNPVEILKRSDDDSLPILHKPFGVQELMRAVTRTLDGERKDTAGSSRQTTTAVDARAIMKNSPTALADAPVNMDKPAGRRLRVLLIDDHEVLLNLVADMIRKLGHTCIGCSDAGQARDILNEQHGQLDVVITDYSMPGINGGEILESCRRDYPNLYTILLTGYSEHDAAALARGKGADGVLLKPPNPQTLTSALERACG